MIGPGGTICHRGLKYKTNQTPYVHKRRLRRSPHLSVTFQDAHGNKQVPSELIFHYAWAFLTTQDIINLCRAAPIMSCYSSLRRESKKLTRKEIKDVLYPLDHSTPPLKICQKRSNDIAMLLLLCDFDIGKLIRLLQGSYTGDFLDFPLIDSTLNKLSSIPLQKGEPRHDFDLLHKVYHDRAPSSGHFTCNRQDMLARNFYNNHSAAHPHFESIEPKIASDIQKSYAIALPRRILRFIDGLLIAAIGWASRQRSPSKRSIISSPSQQ